MAREVKRPDFYRDQESIISLLKSLCPYNIMPDLFDALGDIRIFFNVMRLLAGTTVTFPPLETIQTLLIAIDIILTLTENGPDNVDWAVRELSKDYGILPRDVYTIYVQARDLVTGGIDTQRDAFVGAVNMLITKRGTNYEFESVIRRQARREERRSRKNVKMIKSVEEGDAM